MQIAYLNKGKIKAKTKTDQLLESFYLRDIHKAWLKRRKELEELGFNELEFVRTMKLSLKVNKAIFMDTF